MDNLSDIRSAMRAAHLGGEAPVLEALIADAAISDTIRQRTRERAIALIEEVRNQDRPGLMEVFLAEYGLSTDEGVALMCLAEALLRVPDADTIDALIEDKIAPSDWSNHLGQAASPLVNASTWALMLTGKVLREGEGAGIAAMLRGAIKRVGEPVIRAAVARSMEELGQQFVLGRDMAEALRNAAGPEGQGFTYSYDMLGEAALTEADARAYFEAYAQAISALAPHSTAPDTRDNPGISVKLSALHPRYEATQHGRIMTDLVPRLSDLARRARAANMGFTIDAEEADRLDLSLDVIEAVVADPRLAGWDGFGVVVQAYGKRARHVIDWLHTLARAHDRHFMVRLVKGAYWDTEIKRAQIGGFADFPVFTRKPATDVSYICCAARLLGKTDRLYPQFATHNAHSVAAIMELAGAGQPFEFQRLHGMGEALHARLKAQENTRCRIYAPVGAHRDLLAYLVRRLLENGANSSFVNQIVDVSLPASVIAGDPFDAIADAPGTVVITTPDNLYAPRRNSRGHDLTNTHDRAALEAARAPFQHHIWRVGQQTDAVIVANPADPDDIVGHCHEATQTDIETALAGASDWSSARVDERARILRRASDLLEERCGEVFAAISREAGKTTDDCVLELREAVDFLRFYAAEAERLGSQPPRGIFACISPWNFPLAIFTGQVAAALAAGNGVVAKPAEQTPITASLAVRALHDAGVPANALRFLPGGGKVGASLTSDARIDGVCFTGSTATAQAINRAMATNLAPGAPLIAETGGLNAMIVDSTALPEQAVADIVASAFRSAGQRCSALRVLYLQEDIAEPFTRMLLGAMATLSLGDPWEIGTDMGPVIDEVAHRKIHAHIATARAEGRLLLQLEAPGSGFFIGPAAISIDKLADLSEEIFGPVLHIATFDAARIEQVVDDINASGYGLTFGMHSRIDGRIQNVTSQLKVGNIYINRNQIGAVVGTQPFGGEGLSGTGPKAGGPRYVGKFMAAMPANHRAVAAPDADIATVQSLLDAASEALRKRLGTTGMPGPTGESNQLSSYPRGTVLCLGPSAEDAVAQAAIGRRSGCASVMVAPDANGDNAVSGFLARNSLASLRGVDAVILWGEDGDCRAARQALARRAGPIVPLIISSAMEGALIVERHICVDTTAAGGNASLLTQAS